MLVVEPVGADTVQLTINGEAHLYDRRATSELRVTDAGGDDRIEVSNSLDIPAVLNGGAGNDTLLGGAAADQLDGGDGIDSLLGDDGDDLLVGDPADTFDSGPGIDSLTVRVTGTDGDDLIRIDNIDSVTTRLSVNGVHFDYPRYEFTAAEIAAGGGNDFVELAADVSVNARLLGESGDDTLVGGAGRDTLDGGEGQDSLADGAGDDSIVADHTDILEGGIGADFLALLVTGTDGSDVIRIDNVDAATTRLTLNGVFVDYARGELVSAEIRALSGNDLIEFAADAQLAGSIVGGDGDDTLVGGLKADTIDGGLGHDSLVGGADNDVLTGSDGLDTIRGDSGDDSIDGGADDDSLEGLDGADTIWGNAGSDTIVGGNDADSLGGGLIDGDSTDVIDGADLVLGGAGNDTIYGAAGADSLDGESGDDSLDGGLDDDSLTGGDGADTLIGGSENDTLMGGTGDDVLDAERGIDQIDGGLGFDIVKLVGTDEADSITAIPDATGNVIVTIGAEADTAAGLELIDVQALFGDDSVTIDEQINLDAELDGGAGDDTLLGGHGSDILTGGAGNDSLDGRAGYDTIRFFGTEFDDDISAAVDSTGEIVISAGPETDTAAGIDELFVNARGGNDSVVATFHAQAPVLPVWLEGRGGDDTLVGGPGDDFLYGGGGDDSIDGGGGDDILLGSSGDDSLLAGPGNDSVLAATGNDCILGGPGNDTLVCGDGYDTALGEDGNDSIDGGQSSDSLYGGPGMDSVIGGPGNDTIEGFTGNDSLYDGLGNDLILGGDGADTMGSDQGNDTFFGGNGDDQISGGADDDVLDGGEGADLLDGGPGNDQSIGGDRDRPRRQRSGCDDDTLRGAGDDDVLDGGRGRDLLDGGEGTNDITADLTRDTVAPGLGVNRIQHIRKTDAGCREGDARSAVRSDASKGRGRLRELRHLERSGGAPILTDALQNRSERPNLPANGARVAIKSHEPAEPEGRRANLAITTTTTPTSVPSGEILSYKFAVTNAGPYRANHVTVYDTLATDVAILSVSAQQADGQDAECEFDLTNDLVCEVGRIKASSNAVASVTIDVGVDAPPGDLSNTGAVNSTTPDPNKTNNSQTVTTPVTPELPVVIIEATDGVASEPGMDTGQFRITRYQVTNSPLTVSYAVGGSASSGSDYQTIPTTVTIPAGQCCALINVVPWDDFSIEGPESVDITLNNGTAYRTEYPATASVGIRDNETAQPTVSISTLNNASESSLSNGRFTVTRTPVSNTALTVSYVINPSSTATAGSDYNPLTGTVTIPANSSSAQIVVTPRDDLMCEVTETLIVDLSPTAVYMIASPPSASVSITDNDCPQLPLISVTTADGNAAEATPVNTGKFTITRSGPTSSPLPVSYTVSGTATAGADYNSIGSSVTIPAGQSSVDITVTPIDDAILEPSETVIVTLDNSPSYIIVGNTATVTIADNDGPVVTITAPDPSAAEGIPPNTGRFTVTRVASDYSAPLTVGYKVEGTATNGLDYNAIAASVTIPADATSINIDIIPVDDTEWEHTETVVLTLLENDPNYAAGDRGFGKSATVSIADNDGPPCGTTGTVLTSLEWDVSGTQQVPNPSPVGGVQIFPDKNDPLDFPHNTVWVKATVSPAAAGIRIYFKAFDPDDPESNTIIDPNGPRGDDNNGDPRPGVLFDTFADTSVRDTASARFDTTKQPGDNFRVAASCVSTELGKLTVANPSHPHFVGPNDAQVGSFEGRLTRLLTVWRRLWVELDSMRAVPMPIQPPSSVTVSGKEWKLQGSGFRFKDPNHSAIVLTTSLPRGMRNDAYEDGYVIPEQGEPIRIVGNSGRTIILERPPTDLERPLFLAPHTFVVQDDDDPTLLSNLNLLTERIKSYFRRGYIELIDANEGLPTYTPNRYIDFQPNTPQNSRSIIAAKDLQDEPWFWVQTLVAGYQPEEDEDVDPDENFGYNSSAEGEEAVKGWTHDRFGASIVFLETIRDLTDGRSLASDLGRTVAHETGHGPGLKSESSDHAELSLMGKPIQPVPGEGGEIRFREVTISRFRKTSRWYGPLVR